MIKSRSKKAGSLSVFSLLAIAAEYTKAIQENPEADRKKTLREIKKKATEHRTQKCKSNSQDTITNNDQVMKRIIQQAKELLNMIDEEVKNREKKQEARVNAKKDREYQEETEVLNQLLNTLNDAICALKTK